jgi:quercetin dioxygenase-like cupin family protein
MNQKLKVTGILAFLLTFSTLACNEQQKKDESTKTEVSKSEANSMPVYDPAMDPVKVEAAFNKVLADTLNVKLHEVTLNPGDSVGMHTHPDFTLYILQGGTLKIYPKGDEPQVLELKTGMGLIFPTITHSGKNIGKTTIKLLVSDIYRPRN